MNDEQRHEMIQKRVAFIHETLKGYSSLEEYARDREEWFAILGINLQRHYDYLSLFFYLDPFEEEVYSVSLADDGRWIIGY
ncbi:hypothetical protein [Bacteroides acidifaciens]|uniref:hypothetical protein n=1 Tax=Bacteroides acidifaciens TaxID=85831 RepID=UPI003F4DA751